MKVHDRGKEGGRDGEKARKTSCNGIVPFPHLSVPPSLYLSVPLSLHASVAIVARLHDARYRRRKGREPESVSVTSELEMIGRIQIEQKMPRAGCLGVFADGSRGPHQPVQAA